MAKAKRKISKKAAMAVGVGAAAAAAAVGAYWFYGSSKAAEHRKAVRSWMFKARGDVLAAVEAAVKKAGEIDKETYMNIVGSVLKRYSKTAGVKSAEILQMTRDMKEMWERMQKAHKNSAKTPKKAAKKSRKKAR